MRPKFGSGWKAGRPAPHPGAVLGAALVGCARVVGKPTAATHHTGDADLPPAQLERDRIAVEHMHAECSEHGRDAVPEPPIVIVIAEHRDHRHCWSGDLGAQQIRFVRPTALGEIAAQQQHVGVQSQEVRAETSRDGIAHMQIRDGGDPEGCGGGHGGQPATRWTACQPASAVHLTDTHP